MNTKFVNIAILLLFLVLLFLLARTAIDYVSCYRVDDVTLSPEGFELRDSNGTVIATVKTVQEADYYGSVKGRYCAWDK